MQITNASDDVIADETHIWYTGPTQGGAIALGVVVPAITSVGAVFNIINVIIYTRPKMTASTYSYFLALSVTDCISCIFVFFSGLARTVFWQMKYWAWYDVFVHLCIGGVVSGIGNLVIVFAAVDRIVYIKNRQPKGHPAFCSKSVARKIIFLSTFISIVVNFPYFFIYRVDSSGTITTAIFFESYFYQIHNWLRFVVTGLFPAIFLMVGNGIMINYIRKWSKCSKLIAAARKERNFFQDQRRLTITLVAVVFLFIIGEIPTYFASRQSAITLLYKGDIAKTASKELEIFRIVATILNALHLSINLIIYATLNPAYLRELYSLNYNFWCRRTATVTATTPAAGNCENGNN